MSSFSPPHEGLRPLASELLRRKPERVTIAIHWSLRQKLQALADQEGRSPSNLLVHLLETAIAG
jgi:hypothetical protein